MKGSKMVLMLPLKARQQNIKCSRWSFCLLMTQRSALQQQKSGRDKDRR